MVEEPDEESAISILRGIKDKYEQHHKIGIKDEAIIAAVKLSTRYITDRFLPDKAIDLMDEAASKLRMEMNSKPEELDKLDRKIVQLEIEIEAIKREDDEKKLNLLREELSNLQDERNQFSAKWQDEKNKADEVQDLRKAIENIKFEIDRAKREYDYAKASKLEFEDLVNAKNALVVAEEKLEENKQNKLVKEFVDADDIAEVVARWTGVPAQKMMQSEREKLLHLEDELHQRVMGQDEAITAVADAIRRSRAGLS